MSLKAPVGSSPTRGTIVMNILTKLTDLVKIETDALVVFAWTGKKPDDVVFSPEAHKVDAAMGGLLTTLTKEEGYAAGVGKTFVVHTHGKISAKRVIITGLGSFEKRTISQIQIATAAATRRAKAGKIKHLAIAVPQDLDAQAVVEGVLLGNYQFTRHKTVGVDKLQEIEECVILTFPNKLNVVHEAVQLGQIIAQGVLLARDLVNESPSVTTPTYLADVAKKLAGGVKDMTCDVFGRGEITKMGMGGLLGIARGSDQEPKFIKLSYNGGGRKTIALIGKGITFDTGGLSMKPAAGMETMKLDMSAAAAILGVFSVLSVLKPKVNVVGLISATENMVGPKSVKPGDVVKIMNGKTVEILNTDAEGRMVLADALSYAVEKVKPNIMIDLATLTGACVVALGEEVAGLFSSDEKLAEDLLRSGKASGESVWHMPLVEEYRDMMKGTISDLQNIGGGKWGGAITGALFLQEFTDPTIPWAHLDIAGPAYQEKEGALAPIGGTGFGVRMLLSYLLSGK